MILALINLMRVRQWTKNTFVLAIPFFSGDLAQVTVWIQILPLFLGFCVCSSVVYVINDLLDFKEDSKNPYKAKRPLVSGIISKRTAVVCALVLLWILGCAVLFDVINTSLAFILFIYLLVNIAYSAVLKNIPILEMLVVSFGFVLRLLAGAVVTSINASEWIVVCTWLVSLFLLVGKRLAELNRGDQRRVLSAYNSDFMRGLLMVVFAGTLMAYILFCIDVNTQARFGTLIFLTLPIVFFGLAAYARALIIEKIMIDPTTLIFIRKDLLISGSLWLVIFVGLLY